ncbi:auxin-responsive protein IAA29 isoform X2 [Brassica rapa]|uniref:auxin-responsive protein IAA29 isoform X2 n=1 Tax=Brassica campestris TaxID=3711 RepID=UPI0004F1C39D|nr:auxin-responsive protein IAA29 isoform X2 [Brassica rapa]XP_048636305.1 auxin-responsive protein IAA29-like isoform X2 [Brassica napus]
MELDLDLSLSPHTNSSNFGLGFDLNKHLNTKEKSFDAMLGLENMEEDCYVSKPRSFSLNGQSDKEDDDPLEPDSSVVYERINISNQPATIERGGPLTSLRSSMYVKVKMDGVAITRKVDIKLFNSYESLTNSLITMFSQYQDCDREDTNFKFTFQGKEGDWLLPGDVPWKIFAESVHRISITRDCLCPYTRLLF